MKSLRLYLLLGGLLLTTYIVAQLNKPKEIDWAETLSSKDKIPFGTYVLYDRLKDLFPGAHITPFRQAVYNVIAEDSVKQASYIIICSGIELSKPDYTELTKYIKEGNDVFIAAQYFGKLFEKNSVSTDLFLLLSMRLILLFSTKAFVLLKQFYNVLQKFLTSNCT